MSTHTSETIIGPGGVEFFTRKVTPSGIPTIASAVFVHGFIEHVGRYDYVFDQFAANGIETFAFDQRGFGKTGVKSGLGATSWKLALDDISFFVNSEHINSTLPIFLIGHSMGGGLTIAFATREVDQPGLSKLKGIISSSPLILVKSPPPAFIVKLASIIGTIAPRFQMKQAVVPEAISRDPVVNAAYAIDPLCAPIGTYKGISNMLIGGEQLLKSDFARFPASLPLLVTHGSGDLVTDHDASENLVLKLKAIDKDAAFISLPGYFHEAHNEPGELKDVVINHWIDFIKSKL